MTHGNLHQPTNRKEEQAVFSTLPNDGEKGTELLQAVLLRIVGECIDFVGQE
jgi:hypothetical protein